MIQPYDLYISYVPADREWIEADMLPALRRAGLFVLTDDQFAIGARRIEEMERAIRQSRRTLICVSEEYLASPMAQFVETLAQSYGSEQGSWQVIPLLLELVVLPVRLSMLVALAAVTAAERAEAIARLIADSRRLSNGESEFASMLRSATGQTLERIDQVEIKLDRRMDGMSAEMERRFAEMAVKPGRLHQSSWLGGFVLYSLVVSLAYEQARALLDLSPTAAWVISLMLLAGAAVLFMAGLGMIRL